MTDEEAWFMAFREANFLEARVVVGGDEVFVVVRGFRFGGFLLSDFIRDLFANNSRWGGAIIGVLLTFLRSAPSAMVAMPACAVVIDPDAEAFGFLLFPVLRALGADRGVIAGVIVLEMNAVRGE